MTLPDSILLNSTTVSHIPTATSADTKAPNRKSTCVGIGLPPSSPHREVDTGGKNRWNPESYKHSGFAVRWTKSAKPESHRHHQREKRGAQDQIVVEFEHVSYLLGTATCLNPPSEQTATGITPA